MKPRTLTAAAVCAVMLTLTACDAPDVRSVARAVRASAPGLASEFDAAVRAGELTAEQGQELAAIAREAAAGAADFTELAAGWEGMSRTERRAAVVEFADRLASSADRLEAAGALHIKNPDSRRRFERNLQRLRRGVAVARVAQAALDEPGEAPLPKQKPRPSRKKGKATQAAGPRG